MPDNLITGSDIILIVEEHPALRVALRDWLMVSFPDYCVITSFNYTEAINRIKEDSPCLVILDFCLTGIKGQQAIQHIKAVAPSIKIVILTLVDDEIYRSLFTSAGANAQVSKQSLGVNLIPTMDALLKESCTLDQ